MHWLIRFVVGVLLVVATFVPNFGLLWLGIANFAEHPWTVGMLGLLWVVVFSMLLPLTRAVFQVITTTAVMLVASGLIYLVGLVIPAIYSASWWPLWMWGVLVVAIGLAWLTNSTRIHRWARGVVQVEDSGGEPV